MSGYNRALLAIDRYAERKKEEDAYADFMKDYNDWMADLKNAGSIGTIAGAVIGFFASGGNPEGAKQGAFYGKQLGTAGYFSARGSDPVLEYEDLDDYVGNDTWSHIPEEYDFDYVAKNVKDIIKIMKNQLEGSYIDFEEFAEEHFGETENYGCDCRDWIDWQRYIDDKLEGDYVFNYDTGHVWKIKGDENE